MPFKGFSHELISTEDHFLEEVVHQLAEVELNVFIYDKSSYSEKKCSNVTGTLSAVENNDNEKCVWIEVIGRIDQRYDVVQQMGTHFNLHLLTIEDIQTIEERMKLNIFDDGIFLLMKAIYIDEQNQTKIHQQQISFYLQENILITFQEKQTPFFSPIKHKLASNRGKLRELKSDYLFYCLVDTIVENYMIFLDLIGLTIQHVEIELMQMKTPTLDTLKLIYNMKHDMLHFRIICSPLKDITVKLQKSRDRLPRRDAFAAQRRGPTPLRRKRCRTVTQRPSVRIVQPIISRRKSVSPIRHTILRPLKPRAKSLSTIRSDHLAPVKSRGKSIAFMQTDIVRRIKSIPTVSHHDGIILHEYIFTYLRNLHVHILHMSSTIDTHSETIDWLVKFYTALSENIVRQAVKLLAMMQAVHYPLVFIHGLNSMNFDWVPQRNGYRDSYFIFLSIMILIVLTALTTFKLKKWL